MRDCSDGCGAQVGHWGQECLPVAPWDPPGLPPRTKADRCARHRKLCAYRDDDPTRCPACHGTTNCTCLSPTLKDTP